MTTSDHNRVPVITIAGFTYTAPAVSSITSQELIQELDAQRGPVVFWLTDDGAITWAHKPRSRARIL